MVAHHKTHDSPQLGPNIKFRIVLAGKDAAILHRVGNSEDADVKLVRHKPDA